jgi:mannan endo-1,4-beta-mannosidase
VTLRRRAFLALVGIIAGATLLAGCTVSTGSSNDAVIPGPTGLAAKSPISARAFADDFVTVDGHSFSLGGREFRFVGANIYDAAASSRYSCRQNTAMSPAALQKTMRYLHDTAGVTVLRFWAYQTYTQGATYWAGMDRVLADARAVGIKVIPVLEDGPGDCTTVSPRTSKADYEGDSWFSNGYRQTFGNARLSYRDYVKQITEHYANNPTILGWSMMNEADTKARTSEGAPILVSFATDIAEVIRSVDKRHLLTVGTQSNGAPGASGADFTAVYRLPQIDFAEVHDWGYWGSDTQPMPGGDGSVPPSAKSAECAALDAPIGCSFARARALDKPLVVGEAGMKGVTSAERESRAVRMRAKMHAAFAAGASGYLVWSVTTAETDGYDLRTTTNDPLVEQLKEVAGLLK